MRPLLALVVVLEAVALLVPANGGRVVVLGPPPIGERAAPVTTAAPDPFFSVMTSDDVARGLWHFRDEGVVIDKEAAAAAAAERARVQELRTEVRAARARYVAAMAKIAIELGPARTRAVAR